MTSPPNSYAVDAEEVDVRERDILRINARLQRAGKINASHFELCHRERLRGEHIGHLTGANAEGERSKRAVGGGVRVAAGNGHPRLREPTLGTDDVDDALIVFVRRKKVDAKVGGVLLDVLQHLLRQRILQRPLAARAGGGDDVVHGGEGEFGERHAEVLLAHHRKRLRRGDLVNEMQPNKKLKLPRSQLRHAMPIKNFMI
jgi:hypothetical protein